jgi:hypothetical protein
VNGASRLRVVNAPQLIVQKERGIRTPHLEVLTHPEVMYLPIETINPFAKAVDLRPLLDEHYPGWLGQVTEVAKGAPDKAIVGGTVNTSMAASDHTTYYQPTTGDIIAKELPWFHQLFAREVRHLATRVTGDPTMYLGKDVSSFNMNLLREGDYELHVDRDPLTALLGLTTIAHGEGGELVLHERRNPLTNRPEGESHAIKIVTGIVYLFNGLRHPHEVTELAPKTSRLVAAADYYTDSIPEVVDPAFNAGIGVGQ